MVEHFGYRYSVKEDSIVTGPFLVNSNFVSDCLNTRSTNTAKNEFFIEFCCFVCVEELYGDFEDLETGEVHKGQTGNQDPAEVCRVYVEDLGYSLMSVLCFDFGCTMVP